MMKYLLSLFCIIAGMMLSFEVALICDVKNQPIPTPFIVIAILFFSAELACLILGIKNRKSNTGLDRKIALFGAIFAVACLLIVAGLGKFVYS